jgi:hypothetical protein
MAGTYPLAVVGFETVNFKINTPTLVTETMVGKKRRVGMGLSFYSFSARYSNVTAYDMGEVIGFIAKQYGPLESFQITLPRISFTKSTNQTATTVTTSGAATTGQNSVGVSGVASGKELLKAGDYFKFANHSKVYMCVVDWTAGQPLFFSGSLVADVPSGTQLTITAVPFTVILDNEVQEYSVGYGGVSTMTVDFREVW